MTHVGRNMLL